MEIQVTRADPSGNITLLVEGAIPREKYAEIGAALMNEEGSDAEQVGFLCEPRFGGMGRLEMAGGEFCGNASRSFGMLLAMRQNIRKGCIPIEISGCSEPVETLIDLEEQTAYARMPLPKKISMVVLPQPFGICPLVQFEGIWHLLAFGTEASETNFTLAREAIECRAKPAALGVMFLTPDAAAMEPFVYVRDTGTLFREGSCGSGCAAVGAWLAVDRGCSELTIRQPAGELQVQMKREKGRVAEVRMGGKVSIDPAQKRTIDM